VLKLADGIIDAQLREIGEMEPLIADLHRTRSLGTAPELPGPTAQRPDPD
jgi:hypothetical protein